jgi:hypothetical protein
MKEGPNFYINLKKMSKEGDCQALMKVIITRSNLRIYLIVLKLTSAIIKRTLLRRHTELHIIATRITTRKEKELMGAREII